MTYAENRRRSILRIENHPDAVGGCYQREKDNIAFDPYGVKPRGGRRASRLSSSLKGTSFPSHPLSSHLAPFGSAVSPISATLTITPFGCADFAPHRRADRAVGFLCPEGVSLPPSAPSSSRRAEPTPTAVTADSFSVPKGLLSLPQPLLPRRRLATTAEPFSRQPLRG